MTSPAVLLIVFNRPEPARRQLAVLRSVRPAQLFIAADGPRPGHPGDAALCQATRALVDTIDWPCEVQTLFRDENVGITAGVVSAISWFFEHVEAGIILEDDCLPTSDFFPFAGELLDRYATDTQVMHIAGLNMAPDTRFSPHSYFFTEVGHIWGWATWRRAWRLYDMAMTDWPAIRGRFGFTAPPLQRALGRKFASVYAGRKHTWSRLWYYTVLRHEGLAIIPAVNFIENIGFGADATHTTYSWHPLRQRATGGMTFPLSHPESRTPNAAYTRLLAKYHYGSHARRASELAWTVVDTLRGRR